jgi:uncharacterized protein YegL
MYREIVTHNRRAAFVILIDCSLSMLQPSNLGNLNRSKIEIAELVCNLIIDELTLRAISHGKVRNYYDIAVLGYAQNDVISLLSGDEPDLIAINKLVDMTPMPKTIYGQQTRSDGTVVDVPITYHQWINPRASGSTPMFEALANAYTLVDRWCRDIDNRFSFPPIVINITDGAGNDSDSAALIDMSTRIQSLHTEDGNTLFFNLLLTSDPINKRLAMPNNRTFKSKSRELMTLFKMSSIIPKCLEPKIAYVMNIKRRGPYRALLKDFSPCDISSILSTGTESVNCGRTL